MIWKFIKIPKAIALIAFFLPWLTVSCSDQKIADANGWQLLTGKPHLTDSAIAAGLPESLPVGYLLAAAFALIVVGLLLTLRRRAMPKVLLATSLVALLFTYGASLTYNREAIAAALARKSVLSKIEPLNIQVEWQWGFWLAIVALAVAAAMAWLAMNEARAGPNG